MSVASETESTAVAVDPWPMVKSSYTFVKQLGTGATSTVYEAFCEPKKANLAMKVINLDSNNVSMEELQREIQGMKKIKHENVVQYLGSFCEANMLYILMDLCDRSLLDMIQFYKKRAQSAAHAAAQQHSLEQNPASGASDNTTSTTHSSSVHNHQGLFDEHTIATILKEVLKGLAAIHESGLIHRDIKCGNVLLRRDGSVQIADFGVSGFINTHPLSGDKDSCPLVRYTFVGTPCWMAPEVMEQRREGYTNKADIWSIGITSLELITGSAPYAKYPPMKVIMLTLQNEPPNLQTLEERPGQYNAYGRKIRRFIADCLHRSDSQRPMASQLLQHVFIKRKAKGPTLIQNLLSGEMPPVRARRTTDKAGSGGSGTGLAGNVGASGETLVENEFSSDDDVSEPQWDFPTYTSQDEMTVVQQKAPESEQTLRLRTLAANDQPNSQLECRLRFQLRTRLWKNYPEGQPYDGNPPDLQDIGFDFSIGTDQANGITLELVEQDLLNMHDFLCVSKEIQTLVDNPFVTTRKFPLAYPLPQGAFPDPAQFMGYASLTLTRVSQVTTAPGEDGAEAVQVIDLGNVDNVASKTEKQKQALEVAAAASKRHSSSPNEPNS